ncbi:MAG: EutN/CcmL family microcompartment protein [Myxococcota bacterium]
MYLARVIGTVVASRKEPELEGLKFLLLKACDLDGTPSGATLVAADAVGAGVGEVVLYASGSSARQTQLTQNRPVDAVVMAIVDTVDSTQGSYDKSSDRGDG